MEIALATIIATAAFLLGALAGFIAEARAKTTLDAVNSISDRISEGSARGGGGRVSYPQAARL